jgi:hypothetical protein
MIGAQNARRVRLKCNHDRQRLLRASAAHDLVENSAMGAVHAIKVPDADQRGPKVVWNIGGVLKNQHSKKFFTAETPGKPKFNSKNLLGAPGVSAVN